MQQARQCEYQFGWPDGCAHLPRLTDRVQKLKEARTQATKEIEEYRKFKEEEFKAFEASVRRCAIRDRRVYLTYA